MKDTRATDAVTSICETVGVEPEKKTARLDLAVFSAVIREN
jgi:hypothetical protein